MLKEEIMFKRVFTGAGCEKFADCEGASAKCEQGVFAKTMLCDPAKRWMYCYEWKRKLGMVFDKELGIYILPQWKNELLRRAVQ